jgi:hypothetical protein
MLNVRRSRRFEAWRGRSKVVAQRSGLGTMVTASEKSDLVAHLRAL